MSNWTIKLNGKQFDRWKSFTFSRAIKDNVGKFSLVSSDKNPKDSPLAGNDKIEIFYKEQKCFTGFVDTVAVKGGRDGGSIIQFDGRDPLCDVVDSSLPDKAKSKKGGLTLIATIDGVFKALGIEGIKIIDKTKDKLGNKTVKLQKTGDSGTNAMDYLAELAASLQVWLISDEDGNLNIFRAGDVAANMEFYYLLNGKGKNNILDASLEIDLSQVFAKIKVRGKGSIAFDVSPKDAADLVDINGEHFDDWARPARYLEVKSDDIKTKAQAQQRAKDEVNSRRAKAFVYRVETNIFTDKDGKIFSLGQTMQINDEARQVSGKHIIGEFAVNFDRESGTQTSITFAPSEAYQIVDIDQRQEKAGQTKKHIKKQAKAKAK